jgi:heme-degrading monooxygenase HmoA
MFAVIFEVQPKKERFDDYLNYAKMLKPQLEATDGFIDNERFTSHRQEGRILSLSTWRDEKSVVRWRTVADHHAIQEKGRFEVFEDYHLRVGEIIADTAVPKGEALREQRFDETEIGAAKAVTITELPAIEGEKPASENLVRDLGAPDAGSRGVVDHEVFESIYNPGKLLLLVGWSDAAAARAWAPKALASGAPRHRCVRVVRDYGMFDRREAPQHYPEVARPASSR